MKEIFFVGTSLKVRITKMNPAYPLLAFASIEDDRYEGYGVLHASQVSRIKLNTLSDIFVVGDLVTAHVLETSDNRLSFSILEEIGFSISARFHKDDYTYAKLLAQKENLDIGYPYPGRCRRDQRHGSWHLGQRNRQRAFDLDLLAAQ